MTQHTYLTTTIPYVNARPHLGHALELVQADALARFRRRLGEEVRLLSGTDDNALKNVLAAEAAGVPVQEFVDRNAESFAALSGPLEVCFDDFIRTSRDPRHRVGVERLWRACADAGDLYRKSYEGLYCVGCEQFYTPDELPDGRCPEHDTEPQLVAEENWFFRLSRYADALRDHIARGRLRIEPVTRRNEVLGLIEDGLHDFSVSRSATRARGWGIEVPDDPGEVIYVWWDALGNYITALDYGTDGPAFRPWWVESDRRVHVIGKGVLRFHAVYWPAMLLSAGVPLPTEILVHDYLTVDGRRLSKSAGTGVDPVELVARFGTDPVRWWLLREVSRNAETDFTLDRLIDCANRDLAGGLGNLVHRVATMVHRYRDGSPAATDNHSSTTRLPTACRETQHAVNGALSAFDFRGATAALVSLLDEANRYIEEVRPWELAAGERPGKPGTAQALDVALEALVHTCQRLGELLEPFLPGAARRLLAQCTPVGGRLPAPEPLFKRIFVGYTER